MPPSATAVAMAATKTAQASGQTGFGWVSRLSSLAQSAAWADCPAPKIPSGLIRIRQPLDWLHLAGVLLGQLQLLRPRLPAACRAQRLAKGVPMVEGHRPPVAVGVQHLAAVVPPLVDQRAGQHEGHLGVVRRLAGQVVPCPAVPEVADAAGNSA